MENKRLKTTNVGLNQVVKELTEKLSNYKQRMIDQNQKLINV